MFVVTLISNVPVECLICHDVHWKYIIRCHLQERHPSWERNLAQGNDLNDFRDKILITNEEEAKLGIPEDRLLLHRMPIMHGACRAYQVFMTAVVILPGLAMLILQIHLLYLSRYRHIVKELLLQGKSPITMMFFIAVLPY